jgi:hypothetical protein|tara:strand:+ start:3306 stop:3476 length:171 start_codon:yes stop_codon:yes gene_type:complete
MAKRDDALNHLLARVASTRDEIGDQWPYHADPDTGAWTTAYTLMALYYLESGKVPD